MSYSYVKALVKTKVKLSPWVEEDISEVTIVDILNTYLDVKIQIDTHAFEGAPHYLDINSLYQHISSSNLTIRQWLASLGNSKPDLIEGLPLVKTKKVIYYDAWTSDFDISPYMIGQHPSSTWTTNDRRDLLLKRNNVDYNIVESNCLVTVNGLIHRSSSNEHGFIVKDGAYSRLLCNRTQVGMLDFMHLGGISVINITSDMISKTSDEVRTYESLYLNTGVDVKDKSVLFVIGGYLHFIDKIISEVGDGVFKIDISKMPLVERYFESRKIIDLSSLPVRGYDNLDKILLAGDNVVKSGGYFVNYLDEKNNFGQVGDSATGRLVEDILKNEEYVSKYMDLSQTFMVVIDKKDIYRIKHSLEKTGINGTYYHNQDVPTMPMVSNTGRFCEYIKKKEEDTWVLNIEDSFVPNYLMHTTDYITSSKIVTNNVVADKPYEEGSFTLLEIGTSI